MVQKSKTASQSLPVGRRLVKIIDELDRVHRDAKLDLDFSNPLELLIALILAAQSRDQLVNEIARELFRKYRTVEDYADAPEEQLQSDIRRINFFRVKARRIRNCCSEIIKQFDGKIPTALDDLVTLPGVGRKTANILLGNAFGQQTIGVDTHVMRVSQRLDFTRHVDPDKIESALTLLVPADRRVRFCHLLQYHGRRICVARKPRCPECPVNLYCPFSGKTPPFVTATPEISRQRPGKKT